MDGWFLPVTAAAVVLLGHSLQSFEETFKPLGFLFALLLTLYGTVPFALRAFLRFCVQRSAKKIPRSSNGPIVAFFHPFANDGGGGERVLWAAIQATQQSEPQAISVVYTGDPATDKLQVLERVKTRFSIELRPSSIVFLQLHRRNWVLASSFPRLTLLLQSLGSVILAHEALSLLVPDVFVDTMGYAFSTWYCRWLVPHVAVGSYVHYPFIGTHMVESLVADSGHGVNAGSGRGLRGLGKRLYWRFLLNLYAATGTSIDVVMTNSSWTQAHMQRLWGQQRRQLHLQAPVVLYPPCSVEEILSTASLNTPREKIILCIAQFRPEKNHEMLIRAFARLQTMEARLALVGSVRDAVDESLVYRLRILAKELKIEDRVDFEINCAWARILELLQRSWIGVNGMWCEHFGIGVVEYQAAGLVCVVNDSGGPKEDIVVPLDGKITGYHAHDVADYAAAFESAFDLSPDEMQAMQRRAQASSKRFTGEIFAKQWQEHLQTLLARR